MLDDKNVVAQRDPQDYLGFAARQPEQLKHSFGITRQHFTGREIKNVVYAGMGGSSLVADLAHTWPALNVPYVVCKDYQLPGFVGQDTLVICASYSGNTEETLAVFSEAKQKGAHMAVIAHGGKLADLAKSENCIFADIPACPQPRAAVFYMYRALVEILIAADLAPTSDIKDLVKLVGPLEKAVANWVGDVAKGQNLAKQLAEQMVGKTPIIYAGPKMYPAAYKWKIDVNESAKNTAWCNAYSEFNHNEFMGWSGRPVEKPFAVIDLVSSYEHPRILKRFELSDRLLSGMRPKAVTVEAQGASLLEHLLYLVLLGDMTTTYLAVLNGVNPAPVELIEKFKKQLG